MPELLHEIPSPEELSEYVAAKIRESCFESVRLDVEQNSRFLGSDAAREYETLKPLGLTAFAERALAAVLAGLTRMNEHPRTDAFWENTNRRPTLYKLGAFCHLALTRDGRDETALWSLAVLPVLHSANDFGQGAWERLRGLGKLEPRWPILAALMTQLHANPTADQLAAYLRAAGPDEESDRLLRQIAAIGPGSAAAWAESVLRLIDL